ncbi:DNA polymerase III subunit gamma/tau [Salinivibrio kushneri]|uniref:DNA polymerase III subunit gamma/tau n=1 Tax=Salinivibrio kushneri TaxID=1908198 RepID=UPI000987486D|nr:DNA polymerase III subunit gamma/tau [Salinivibrio kushneri]OOE48847.1 DNA polymerase III subunit gamma/tau [Salinivibrio kushneri]OOE51534.1 DNA polymerase III subunit gamma/tau [Salinivibrio kushneri]OOE63213.1 DNA polymerase III subunit gamma/tau [Salinivibrio kushneri]
MSYQVLARKWRPHNFESVAGQSHVLTALANALDHDRLHHAYLFSGTRGVGKTTIARIFAKGLNCEQGVSSSPCGQCATCREIDEGRYVDLLEIDAASRTKVEDTRELLDNVQYKPARGRYKVYLIDEVHMLSRHSFNALLKTLEEPPEYVKFLLATTDPQKLPVTILSRCLQFHLKHFDASQIQTQLEHILGQEGVEAESRALMLLSRAAEGSMRDALSLTDQAIALGNGQISTQAVAEMLGTLSTDNALLLLEALANHDAVELMNMLTQIAHVGVEWDGLLKELASQLHHVALAQALPQTHDDDSGEQARIHALASRLAPQDVQLCYQMALQGRQDLPYAPDGRAGLEMVLLRMLAFQPVKTVPYEPATISVPTHDPASVSQQPTKKDPSQALNALKAQVSSASVTSPNQARPSDAPQAHEAQQNRPMGDTPVRNDRDTPESPQNANELHAPAPQQPMAKTGAEEPSIDASGSGARDASVVEQSQPVVDDSVPDAAPAPASEPSASSPASSLIQARNQLRSRMKRQADKTGDGVKKTGRTPAKTDALSVLDRVATAAESASPVSAPAHQTGNSTSAPQQTSHGNTMSSEPYQWRPTQTVSQSPEVVPTLTPKSIKQALEHEKTPAMRDKLVEETNAQDPWCALADSLDVERLVKQMALNAAMSQQGEQVQLILRPDQSHLNTEKAQQQLTQALTTALGAPITLEVQLGESGITPLERREQLYQQKLAQATHSLHNDPNVTFMLQRFAAELEEDSIRPI